MFILMAVTKGDDVIHSTKVALAAHEDRAVVEEEKKRVIAVRDTWLKGNELPWWANAGVYGSFEIVEVPSLKDAASIEQVAQ